MRKEDVLTAIGLCLPIIVCVVFVTLKLISAISWSWWAVTAPIWGVLALTILAVVIYACVLLYRYRRLFIRKV